MGAGIGQVSVEAGYRVLLKDEQQQGLSRGEAQIKANLDPKVRLRLRSRAVLCWCAVLLLCGGAVMRWCGGAVALCCGDVVLC